MFLYTKTSFARRANEKTSHVRLDSTSRRYDCLSCLISSCSTLLCCISLTRKWRRLSFLLFRTTNRIFVLYYKAQWLNDKRGVSLSLEGKGNGSPFSFLSPDNLAFCRCQLRSKLKVVTNGSKHLCKRRTEKREKRSHKTAAAVLLTSSAMLLKDITKKED